MKLKDILDIINDSQDIQLMSGITGEVLTSVCYPDDSMFYQNIEIWLNNEVLGIAPAKCTNNPENLYLRIMINTKRKD